MLDREDDERDTFILITKFWFSLFFFFFA